MKRKPAWSASGQSLLEFLFVLPIFVALVAGTGLWAQAEWNRDRCAYQVFEATHAKLIGAPLEFHYRHVVVEDSAEQVFGKGQCGKAQETVHLKRIEPL